MNRRYKGNGRAVHTGRAAFVLMIGCFVIGLILGCLLASLFKRGSDSHLSAYLDGYFYVLETGAGTGAPLISTFWEVCRWPVLAGVLGTTLFGVIAMPILLFLRGVLLTYAISILICLYGGGIGVLLALCIFGVPALCSVVALFIIGWNVLYYHGQERGEEGKGKGAKRLISNVFTISVWIVGGTVIQHWICPALLSRIVAAM